MWEHILQQGRILNLVVAIAFAFASFVVYLFGRPKILERGFGQGVFWVWSGMWFVWAFAFAFMIRHPGPSPGLLVLVDLQTVMVIATAWMLMEGDNLNPWDVIIPVIILFGVLTLWSLLMEPQGNASVGRRMAWVAPSETVAVLSMPFIGLAFFARYRAYGFPFLLVTIGYGGLQIGAYSASLLNVSGLPSEDAFFVMLAVGKAFLGALFFGLFFFALDSYPTISPPLEPGVEGRIRQSVGRATGWALGTLVVPLLLAIVSAYLTSKFKR